MNFLQKNLDALPKLKELYSHYKDELYPVESSKNENITLKLNNIYLHSKYDPVKEASRVADILLNERDEFDVIILYGCGLGYVARLLFDKIIKNSKSAILPHIIYIEADIKIFLTSIVHFDWSEIFQNEHVNFFLEAEKELIGSFIQTIPTKRIRYYHHRPSYNFNENYYKEVKNYLTYVLDRKDMNTATFTRFQRLWTKNFIYALPDLLTAKSINLLKNISKNSTSVIVAGGPTLEKNISYLKSIKDNAIIIAVDTVYKFLKKHSIIPDILVVIDPQFWNYKYVENEKIDNSIVVVESSVYHKVLGIAPNKNYFIGASIFQIAKYFEENNAGRGTLAAGGSVSTSAFDIARIIGSKDIILLGLDLSYPGRMIHFRGSFFETNFLNFCDYFNTAECLAYKYLAHTPLKIIDSTNGKVFTDQKMYLFKKWFDKEIPLIDAKVYLPDAGGALLEGTEIISLDKLPIPDKKNKLDYIKNINELLKIKIDINWDNLKNKINNILKHSKDIKEITQKILNLIPESGIVKEDTQRLIENYEKELFNDNNRAEILRVISSSAQDILLSIIENIEYNKDEKVSVWIKSRLLYDSIIKLCDFYDNCLNKLLKIWTLFHNR